MALLGLIKRDPDIDMSLIGALDTSSRIIVGRAKVNIWIWWINGVNPVVNDALFAVRESPVSGIVLYLNDSLSHCGR